MSQELCTCNDGAYYMVDGKTACCECRKEVPWERCEVQCTGPYAVMGGGSTFLNQRMTWVDGEQSHLRKEIHAADWVKKPESGT